MKVEKVPIPFAVLVQLKATSFGAFLRLEFFASFVDGDSEHHVSFLLGPWVSKINWCERN